MVMAKRLLADDVFPGGGAILGHLRMQAIRGGDGDHLDVFFFEHLAVVGETRGMPNFFANASALPGVGEATATTSASSRHDLQRCGVNVRLKLRSDDSDFYSSVVRHA